MVKDTPSFTLEDMERQDILDPSLESQSKQTSASEEQFAQARPDVLIPQAHSSDPWFLDSSSEESLALKAGKGAILQNSTAAASSQSDLEPTQEDSASLRRQIDEAPKEVRNYDHIHNPFDDEPSEEEHSIPLSQLPPVGQNDIPFSPPSSSAALPDHAKPTDEVRVAATPLKEWYEDSEVRAFKTPAGLTQMFKSSQDTPLLSRNKSKYISIRESQNRRQPAVDNDASIEDEDDPDFPKVRRAAKGAGYEVSSAAHRVHQRLRDRSLLQDEEDVLMPDVANLDRCKDAYDEFSVVPASDPQQIRESQAQDRVDQSNEVIVESQLDPVVSSHDDESMINTAIDEVAASTSSHQPDVIMASSSYIGPSQVDEIAVPVRQSSTCNTNEARLASTSESDFQAATRRLQAPNMAQSTRAQCNGNLSSRPAQNAANSNMANFEREQSAGSAVVVEPVPVTRVEALSRKRGHGSVVQSSFQDDEDMRAQAVSTGGGRNCRPHKRPRASKFEIKDSQLGFTVPQSDKVPALSTSPSLSIEQGDLRAASKPSDDYFEGASPLSSLDSQDFSQKGDFHKISDSHSNYLARRVFVFQADDCTYQTGLLMDSPLGPEQYKEDTMISVILDTGAQAEVELLAIRPLELRIDDVVKVNVVRSKSKQWVIQSLTKREEETACTDIFGNTHFCARSKDNTQTREFAIKDLRIPAKLFDSLTERTSATTMESKQIQSTETHGIFKGLVICITMMSSKGGAIETKITDHGGQLLSDGFESLFEYDQMSDLYDIAPRRLKQRAYSFKAALLIANKPARTVKYLQALSLSLPCLHYSFINDSIAAGQIVDIRPYVLAAGEGRISGETVWMSNPCSLTLEDGLAKQVQARRRVWSGKRVIVVVGEVQERQVYLFLSWALGCADLTECATLEDAQRLLTYPEDGKRWDMIAAKDYVQGSVTLRGRIVTNEDIVQSLITGRFCISRD